MLTLEQVQTRLGDRRLASVARGTGLHYETVWRVARGKIRPASITYETIKRLSDYLMAQEG